MTDHDNKNRMAEAAAELPSTAVREMCSLQQVEHDNVSRG